MTTLPRPWDETVIEDGAGQTVAFGLDGRDYQIDLTNKCQSP